MDLFDDDIYIDNNEPIYQKEINLGFFNLDNEQFEDIIKRLTQSSFSKKFCLKTNIMNYEDYSLALFEEKKQIKNEIIIEEEEEIEGIDDEKRISINFYNCKLLKERKKEYDKLIKEKIDFYFIFNGEKINEQFLDELYECSKLNYIIFTLGKNINEELTNSDKYAPNAFDYFEISEEDKNKYKDESNIFIFDNFISKLKSKFDLYKIFQKYSIEKSIISFKDYLYNFNKYNSIEDENKLIELFNKFEKFSFNNDYCDITIILLQIMMNKKNIFNSDFTFNARTLNCGFCLNKLNESEFDNDSKCFLCYRCKYAKDNYPGK